MLRAVNSKLIIVILAALSVVGAVLLHIERDTHRQAAIAQQAVDNTKNFADEVERLKKQQHR